MIVPRRRRPLQLIDMPYLAIDLSLFDHEKEKVRPTIVCGNRLHSMCIFFRGDVSMHVGALYLRVVCCCVGLMDIVRCRRAKGNGGMRVQYVDPGRKEETFVRRVRGDMSMDYDVIGILSRSFGRSKAKMGTWVKVVSFA